MTNRETATAELKNHLISLEKHALDVWYIGNPDAYLDIYMKDEFTYFDPVFENKVVGYEKIYNRYQEIKGLAKAKRYEFFNEDVQASDDMAVLTYQLFAYDENDNVIVKWNCTEVFRLDAQGEWKIIHSHWSFTKPLGAEDAPL